MMLESKVLRGHQTAETACSTLKLWQLAGATAVGLKRSVQTLKYGEHLNRSREALTGLQMHLSQVAPATVEKIFPRFSN